MAKFCSACGSEVPEGASYCGSCGRPLSEEVPPMGREASHPQAAAAPQNVPSTSGQAFASATPQPPPSDPAAAEPSLSVPPSPQRQIDAREAKDGHSRLGVASFVLALITGLLFAYTLSLAATVEEGDLTAGDLGLACIFMTLVALGLGIAGLVRRQRKRLFAILGIVVSIANPFVVIAIFSVL